MNMDVASNNYQSVVDRTKSDLKSSEDRGVSRAKTLEDIRDTAGKSFRTADLEKLMEKYDPEAYAQYSKFAKGADGARTQGGVNFLSKWMDGVKKGLKDGTISSDGTSNAAKANEEKLSSKAQDFLKNLRKQYGKYDFFVGNNADDIKALSKSGNKEFSVIFSNAELERMASDEDYAKEKMRTVEKAVKMSEEIVKKYGVGKDGTASSEISKIGIVFHDDGTTSFFAELEKSSAKQRERIDKSREEKQAEKKKEEKKAEKEIQKYAEGNTDTRHTAVSASSMEELLKKISEIDWGTVKAEKAPESGSIYDFSV